MIGQDFFTLNDTPLTIGAGSYHPGLVLLSYLVACTAAYVGARIARDLFTETEIRARRFLHLTGALALGTGIWSMHFIGMLAYRTDIYHEFDPTMTVLSFLMAVIPSSGIFLIVRRNKVRAVWVAGGTIFMGLAICGMHYTGMAAMQMDAIVQYRPGLFTASVAIAVAASAAAMAMIYRLVRYRGKNPGLCLAMTALTIGIAVCGMHYTAMAAAVISPFADCRYDPDQNFTGFAIFIATVNIGILGLYSFRGQRRFLTLLAAMCFCALPIILIIDRSSGNIQEQIEHTERQKQSISAHIALMEELRILMRLRGLLFMYVNGSAEAQEMIAGLKDRLTHQIKGHDLSGLADRQGLAQTQAQILELIKRDNNIRGEDLFIAYSESVNDLIKNIGDLAANFDLELGDEDPRHKVAQSIIGQTPYLLSSIGNIRGRVGGFLAQQDAEAWSPEEIEHVKWLYHSLKFEESVYLKSLVGSHGTYEDYYATNIEDRIEQTKKNIERLLTGQSLGATPIEFFEQASESLDAYYGLYSLAIQDFRHLQGLAQGRHNSERIYLLTSSILALMGLASLFVYLYRNLLANELAQRRYKRQTLFLDALLDNIPIAIFAKDVSKNFTFALVNKMSENLFGRTREEMLGKTDYDLFPQEEADSYRRSDITVMEENRILDIDQERVTTEDGPIIAHTLKVPIKDQDNDLLVLLGILEDITEKVKARQDLEQAKIIAENANLAKTDFLANMSHEIRTPLNSIIGMGELLREHEYDSERQEMFDSIMHSSRALLAIVNDILDLSKIEAREVKLEHIPFDLIEKTHMIVQSLLPEASKKGLDLSSDISREKVFVYGDPLRFGRILTNLLSNGLRYTEEGYVRLTMTFGRAVPGQTLMICAVEDSGIGIAEDRLDKVFEKFTQEDSSTTRKYGGTGLGLAIVKELVSLMGGTIRVESRKNQGTKFIVEVPFDDAEAAAFEAAAASALSQVDTEGAKGDIPADRVRVLIAEDHVMNQLLLRKIFKEIGITHYEICDDGAAAVDAVKTGNFDLVLMDCHMPRLNGYDATRAIRALPDTPLAYIPIIAMTANAMPTERTKCFECGMDEYMSKPLDLALFKTILSKWIDFQNAPKRGKSAPEGPDRPTPVNLDNLRDNSMGDEAFFREMLDLFVTQSQTQIARLAEQCTDGPNEEWTEISHALKGTAGSVGAEQMRLLCERAQNMADATAAERRDILQKIESRFAEVKTHLETEGLI